MCQTWNKYIQYEVLSWILLVHLQLDHLIWQTRCKFPWTTISFKLYDHKFQYIYSSHETLDWKQCGEQIGYHKNFILGRIVLPIKAHR